MSWSRKAAHFVLMKRLWFKSLLVLFVLIFSLNTPVFADMQVKRCLNLGNALDAPFEGAWGPSITEYDLEWIAGAGFDTVRLPVRFGGHWNGMIWPGFLARVEQVIGWAYDNDLKVILDLHHFDELMADPETYGPVFIAIWTELSERFASHDDRLIFELLNEPHGAVTTNRAVALYQDILPIIRAKHPERWIILGGGNMNSLDEMLTLPDFGPRIALTFHYYDPIHFTHQQSEWTQRYYPATEWGLEFEKARVRADIARAGQADRPIFLGEFGVVRDADSLSRNAWIETVRRAAEDHDISWCYWAYAAGFDLRDFGGYEWYPGLFSALME